MNNTRTTNSKALAQIFFSENFFLCSNFLDSSDNSLSRHISRQPKFENFFDPFFDLKFPFWVKIHPKWIQNEKFLRTIKITFNAKKGLCVNQ